MNNLFICLQKLVDLIVMIRKRSRLLEISIKSFLEKCENDLFLIKMLHSFLQNKIPRNRYFIVS